MKKYIFVIIIMILIPKNIFSWGSKVHQKINYLAVQCLPENMLYFFKKNINYISSHAADPDKRSRMNPEEPIRHYVDIELFGFEDTVFNTIPKTWKNLIKLYPYDTLKKTGIAPWHIMLMYYGLIKAFNEENQDKILFYSTNIGHYIADICVPLHTTMYYDGKTIEQKGIHSFLETRILDFTLEKYNLFVGKAEYIENPNKYIWNIIKTSHMALDTVYTVFDSSIKTYPEDKLFAYETIGNTNKKMYSKEFSEFYEKKLDGIIERQVKTAIKAVSSIWYTAWVNSGQPDLSVNKSKFIQDSLKTDDIDFEKNSLDSIKK